MEPSLLALDGRKKRRIVSIDVPRIGDSTWSLRDSKRGFIYPYPMYANRKEAVST